MYTKIYNPKKIQLAVSAHPFPLRKILVRIILKPWGWLMTILTSNAILRPGISELHPPRYDNLTDPQ